MRWRAAGRHHAGEFRAQGRWEYCAEPHSSLEGFPKSSVILLNERQEVMTLNRLPEFARDSRKQPGFPATETGVPFCP